MYRRNIIRYLLFYQVLVFRDISSTIRDRFPSLETLVPSGYLTSEELEDYLNTPTVYKNYYTPLRWAMNLVRQARNEARVSNDLAVQDLFKCILDYRAEITTLLTYDFQPIPLLYTVVVCLTVRLYFVIALLGSQMLINAPSTEYIPLVDLYIPVMTIIQFIFYMGWMKVAEALLNPFGEDDDDFELNWLLDRNFEVGFVIADQNYDKPLVKDKHWNKKYPEPLYSLSTMNIPIHPLIGSAVRHEAGTRRNSTQPRRKSSMPNTDIIMVPRLPANFNEDADCCETDNNNTTIVRVRSRKVSTDLAVPTLANEVRRKLSYFTGSISPTDVEVGPEDNYMFIRSSTTKKGKSIRRKQVPSIVREDEDKEKESFEKVLQSNERENSNPIALIGKTPYTKSHAFLNMPEKLDEEGDFERK